MTSEPDHGILEKTRFYAVKLPLILVLILLGYILDFLVQLPFLIMCLPVFRKSGRSPKRRAASKSGESVY